MTVDNYVLIACSNSSDTGKWFEMEIGGKKDKRGKEKGMPVRFVIKRLILLILSTCNPTIGFGFLSLFLVLRSCQLTMQWLTVCSFQDTYIFFVPGQNCKRELVWKLTTGKIAKAYFLLTRFCLKTIYLCLQIISHIYHSGY